MNRKRRVYWEKTEREKQQSHIKKKTSEQELISQWKNLKATRA